MSLKMYVLIHRTLTPAQQGVQAGHALAQFGLDHPKQFRRWQEDSNILIHLSVEDINNWRKILEDGGFKHSVFYEPDYGFYGDGMNTAIAVAPNWTCQYILFKDLPLAGHPAPDKKKKWWKR